MTNYLKRNKENNPIYDHTNINKVLRNKFNK